MKVHTLRLAAFLSLGVSQMAIAQTQDLPPDAVPPAATPEDIIVTGSRAVVNGANAPTPVTVVSAEDLLDSAPSNIPDALNKLPQFLGSTGPASGRTLNAGSAPMGNYLNLRNLGSERVLILLDGQRVAPTSNTNAVDVNVLPQLLVKRVDVVTGGASAVYGSDAVSGVVNYVLDEKFTGLKGTAQTGISTYGDSPSYRLGAAGGFAVSDRIHVLASYEYYQNDGIPSLFDRDWAPNVDSRFGAGTQAQPIRLEPPITRCNISTGGTVTSGALASGFADGVRFLPDGTLTPMNVGIRLDNLNCVGGDGGNWGVPGNATSITGALQTHQAFGRVTAELTDSIEMYLQGTYASTRSSFNAGPNNHLPAPLGQNRTTTIFADNPYLRPELAATLSAAGQGSFTVGRIFNDIPVIQNRTSNEYISAQVGLKGNLGSNWRWNATYNYGHAKNRSAFNEISMREFFAAVDAVRDPASGQIVCGVTLRNPGYLDNCVPMNILGEGNISQAAFDFIRRDSVYEIVNQMHYVNANLSGNLFDLPAGPVVLAVGAEYRHQQLRQTSNSNPAIWSNGALPGGIDTAARAAWFAGIRGVPLANNPLLFDSINVGIASGSQSIKEVYGELAIPVLDRLNLSLAGRLTDYKTSGSVFTWKAGGSFEPFDGFRLRATQSRDIAAPSLYNMFAGENLTIGNLNDPRTGQTAVVAFSASGNANLQPERADTTIIGAVYEPAFLPGFSISLDGYRIKVNGLISSPNAALMVNECEASNGSAPVCGFITRPTPDSAPTRIVVSPQNLASLTVQGLDIEVGYSFPVGAGTLSLRGLANYTDKFDAQNSPSQPVVSHPGRSYPGINNDFMGIPKWRGILFQTYRTDSFSIGVSERFTGSYTYGTPTQVFETPIHSPNKTYVDLNTSFDVKWAGGRTMEFFINVQNLFNVDPAFQPNTVTNLSVSVDKNIYDVVGRYFTTGVRLKL